MRDAAEAAVADVEPAALRAAARARLAAWLLNGPAQLRDGPHAGAVAGVIAAHAPAYVYPEITGYFLQWLAHRALCGEEAARLRARAQSAQAWLCRWADSQPPLARIYLEPREDWRNAGVFVFDVAMVLRGLASAADAGLIATERRLVERLDALLQAMIAADGALDACRPHDGRVALPARWSTARGPFLAKAAAGVLAAARLPGVSRALVDAAHRTYAHARDDASRRPHDESHPRLYAIEGLLAREGRGACRDGTLVSQVRALVDAACMQGRIRESAHDAGQARLDVYAQALRAGTLLQALDVAQAPDRASLVFMADRLAGRVTASGGLPFSAATATSELNVWTALFAEQALTWIDLPPGAAARGAAAIV
jgi:hypothetical protein